MDVFEVDCEKLEEYIYRGHVEAWNLLVTEGKDAPEKVEGLDAPEQKKEMRENIEDLIDDHESNNPNMEFSKEHDWFYVRNEATLESLLEFILPHECSENNDLLHLTAVIMTTMAESQIFADGNKRTAYLVGADFLSAVQLDKGMTEKIVVPQLDDELTQILQEVAEKKSSREELYRFLDSLRDNIEKCAEEQLD